MNETDIGKALTQALMDGWLRHPSTRPGEWGNPNDVYFAVAKAVETLTPVVARMVKDGPR